MFLRKFINDIGSGFLYLGRVVIVVALWLFFFPVTVSYAFNMFTILAELVPYNMGKILSPTKAMTEVIDLPRNLISLPSFIENRISNEFIKDVILNVFEGDIIVFCVLLLVFIVMIVREWILQNDMFLAQLRNIDEPERALERNAVENDFNIFPRRNLRQVNMNDEDVERNRQEFLRRIVGEFDAANDGPIANDLEEGADRNEIDLDQAFMAPPPAAPAGDVGDEGVEEFEGIFEFLGFRGSLSNLLSTYSAVQLASILVSGAIYFLPYAIGRWVMLIMREALQIMLVFFEILIGLGTMVNVFLTKGVERFCHLFVRPETLESVQQMLLARKTLSLASCMGVNGSVIAEAFGSFIDAVNTSSFPGSGVLIRVFGTTLGYGFIMAVAALYVSSGKRFATSPSGNFVERSIVQYIMQAEAVLKVTVVIGIELVAFPIYCGILLDVALIPLFDIASFAQRIHFTLHYPISSTSIHWIIGTTYMFLFAMFVTLCRKIIRPGVLYFVRDPNDPNFYPIRDVLERKFSSQLGKIGISGAIYSILITVCIGGAMYAIRYWPKSSFLPISLSFSDPAFTSRAPIFTVYNMTLPIIFKTIRGMEIMKKVWNMVFKYSCSWLRLSSFILNNPFSTEQGYVYYGSLMAWLKGVQPDYTNPLTLTEAKRMDPAGAYFVRDGTFVRAPDSDSLPAKDRKNLFLTVTKDNVLINGEEEDEEEEEDTPKRYHVVYRPPHFRLRISALLLCIWIGGIFTVFSVTGLPLIIGRMFLRFVSTYSGSNGDILAYLIGTIPVFIITYVADNWQRISEGFLKRIRGFYGGDRLTEEHSKWLKRIGKIVFLVGVVLPLVSVIFSIALDVYIIYPLVRLILSTEPPEPHFKLYFTLPPKSGVSGITSVLALKNILLHRFPETRVAREYNRMVREGWMDYNFHIALKFTVGLVLFSVAFFGIPLAIGWAALRAIVEESWEQQVYMFVYPCVLSLVLLFFAVSKIFSLWQRWETAVRDQVYLVGEQLENLDHH